MRGFAIIVLLGSACSETLEARADALGLRLPREPALRLVEERTLPGAHPTVRWVAKGGGYVVKLTSTEQPDAALAARTVRDQAELLQSVFTPKLPPYPEFMTRETGCPDRFLPRAERAPIGDFVLIFAGERMGFGVCSDELATYRAAVAYFYCPQSMRTFSLEVFVPVQAGDQALSEFFDAVVCS